MKADEVTANCKDFTGGFYDKLFEAAKSAKENAYAPYSNYKVGAAVVDENGNIYSGCNVENAAYTGTHAEEAAIASMISNGGTTIKGIVCVTENGGAACGGCRQRIWEFCDGNSQTICYFVDLSRNDVLLVTIGGLLPYAFSLKTK